MGQLFGKEKKITEIKNDEESNMAWLVEQFDPRINNEDLVQGLDFMKPFGQPETAVQDFISSHGSVESKNVEELYLEDIEHFIN